MYAVYCDLVDWAQDADWTQDRHGGAVQAEPVHEEDDEEEPDDEA